MKRPFTKRARTTRTAVDESELPQRHGEVPSQRNGGRTVFLAVLAIVLVWFFFSAYDPQLTGGLQLLERIVAGMALLGALEALSAGIAAVRAEWHDQPTDHHNGDNTLQ